MDQGEDTVPLPEAAQCGEHEDQSKVQRKLPELEPESEADSDSSCESFDSFDSIILDFYFNPDQPSTADRIQQNLKPKEPKPEPSCVSLKSNKSKILGIDFKPNQPSSAEREPAGVRWLKPGLTKYSCQLSVDTNTVSRFLELSEDNRKVTLVEDELQSYPDHPDRFDHWPQLLCGTGLTGRCYWEVEWRGRVFISVTYRRIKRKGNTNDCWLGFNDQSWSLSCSDGGYSIIHNKKQTRIPSCCSSSSSSLSSVSNRVAVYVDCPAGTLSFYRICSDSLIHLYTFNTTFTEPLIPGFWVCSGSSVFLC